MQLDSHTKALLILWLTLPLTALDYWRAFDRAAPRMMASLRVGIGSFVFVLVVITLVNLVVKSNRPDRAVAALVVSYLAVIFVCVITNAIAWTSVVT
jgi:hypothetical protein